MPELTVTERYHPDLMITSILFNDYLIGEVHDNEILKEGVKVMYN